MNRRKAKKHYVTKFGYKHYSELKNIPYCDLEDTAKWDNLKHKTMKQILKEIKQMWWGW